VRKELAVRTIFNLLGPLTNPAGAGRQLLGVSDPTYQETIAEALVGLGCDRALVVRAADGVDEISVADATRVVEVADGGTREWFVRPEELGFELVEIERIAGGTPEQNAATVGRVLAGEEGPARDVVLLNAGAAIQVGGGADDLGGGVEQARKSLDTGAARDVLERLIEVSGRLGDDESRSSSLNPLGPGSRSWLPGHARTAAAVSRRCRSPLSATGW
jgi:anthranilate phosphoribosyltransferase